MANYPQENLPRMQCARAIPVTLLGSGSCQARPSRLNTNEWIYIYIYIYICICTRVGRGPQEYFEFCNGVF